MTGFATLRPTGDRLHRKRELRVSRGYVVESLRTDPLTEMTSVVGTVSKESIHGASERMRGIDRHVVDELQIERIFKVLLEGAERAPTLAHRRRTPSSMKSEYSQSRRSLQRDQSSHRGVVALQRRDVQSSQHREGCQGIELSRKAVAPAERRCIGFRFIAKGRTATVRQYFRAVQIWSESQCNRIFLGRRLICCRLHDPRCTGVELADKNDDGSVAESPQKLRQGRA
ncbi:hypothetical protein R3P38DRAFT_2799736 [Favolaschia claudopus]|uniref:Uncharacterized protein n=1 Tax=Favolaschia claudopus TaxID=2862362 RepID=A0AAW0A0E5_9AGAR